VAQRRVNRTKHKKVQAGTNLGRIMLANPNPAQL